MKNGKQTKVSDLKKNITVELEEKSVEAFAFMNKYLELNYQTPFINNKDAGCIICRTEEGEIVGALFFTHRYYKNKEFLHMDYLAVDDSYRMYGLGHKLIQKCIGYTLAAGLDLITVRTQLRNDAARRALEKNGFRVNENYIAKYDDGYIRLPLFWDFTENKKKVKKKFKFKRMLSRLKLN